MTQRKDLTDKVETVQIISFEKDHLSDELVLHLEDETIMIDTNEMDMVTEEKIKKLKGEL